MGAGAAVERCCAGTMAIRRELRPPLKLARAAYEGGMAWLSYPSLSLLSHQRTD